MKDTNCGHNTWLAFIIFSAFFIQAFSSTLAQKSSTDARLSALLDSAEILKLKGFYPESIRECIKVREKAKGVEDWGNYARSLVEQADVLRFNYFFSRDTKTLREAFSLLELAQETIIRKLEVNHLVSARYNLNKGKLIRDEGIQSPDTLEYYIKTAIQILDKYPNAYHELAKLHYEAGNYYLKAGHKEIAEYHFDKLFGLLANQPDQLNYFRAYYLYHAGNFFFDIADYERSMLCTKTALDIFENPIHRDTSNILACYISVANTYFSSNVLSKGGYFNALAYYNKVIQMLNVTDQKYHRYIPLVMLNMGISLYELQMFDSSMYTLKKAISDDTYNSLSKDLKNPKVNLYLGLIYHRYNQTELANTYFKKAIDGFISNYGAKDYETQMMYREIAIEYHRTGKYDLALQYFQNGLIALYKDFDSENIYDNPNWENIENIEPVLYILFHKAETLFDRFQSTQNTEDLIAAFGMFQDGYKLMQHILASGLMNESLIVFFQNFKEDFYTSVDCAIKSYESLNDRKYIDTAFEFIEQSKYFLLLKSQQSAALKKEFGDNINLFLKERTLDSDIEYLKHMLNEEEKRNGDSAFKLRNQLLQRISQKKGLWEQINFHLDSMANVPAYKNISLKEVQEKILNKGEVIVEYYCTNKTIYTLVISVDHVEVLEIQLNDELKKILRFI
ncbi:MAG: hypothetical protein HC819_00055 [Cyclobacteriaceae bacterium]|nr:hypothetical protein [Cyclobacteriaceae bacterium]